MFENQRRKPKQKRAMKKYSAVLDACTQVLSQCGYKRVSMLSLSLACDVAVPTIYQYFISKEDVFIAWFDRVIDEVLEEVVIFEMQCSKDETGAYIHMLIERALTVLQVYRVSIVNLTNDMPHALSIRLIQSAEEKTMEMLCSLNLADGMDIGESELYPKLAVLVRCLLGYLILEVFSKQSEVNEIRAAEELTLLVASYLDL